MIKKGNNERNNFDNCNLFNINSSLNQSYYDIHYFFNSMYIFIILVIKIPPLVEQEALDYYKNYQHIK